MSIAAGVPSAAMTMRAGFSLLLPVRPARTSVLPTHRGAPLFHGDFRPRPGVVVLYRVDGVDIFAGHMEEIPQSEAIEVLTNAPVAHLAVQTEEGPYVSPLSLVVDGMTVYLRTAPGKRLDALRESPQVCLEATKIDDDTGAWRSAIAYGTVTEVTDEQELARTVELLLAKYRKWISPTAPGGREMLDLITTLRMDIEEVTGRASGRWFGSTRPGRL